MVLLRHNNCDNYPSTWQKWEQKPTREQLVGTLADYYCTSLAKELADDLLKQGEAHANDSDCSVFELETV